MAKQKQLVGLAIETSTSYGRDLVMGIMRYANLRRRWLFMEDFQGLVTDPAEWKRCDGLLTSGRSTAKLTALHEAVRHVVCCSGGLTQDTIPIVCIDDGDIGRLAAEHLIECGLLTFGYYCIHGQSYPLAERRLDGFRSALESKGYTCPDFRSAEKVLTKISFRQPRPHWAELVAWLRTLPKPVGILATDDNSARDLAAACLYADIGIPDHVALLGVNNDQLLCESAWPPLSSINTNFQRVGYAAAERLDRIMNGEKVSAETLHIRLPPAGIARRASTDVTAVDDPNVAEAIRYIRDHACDPCTVDDVVRHVAIARRRLERHCLAKLGSTLHDRIIQVRLETAKRLLLNSELTVPEIAEHSGFSTTQLNRTFRQVEGESPTSWRKSRISHA